jgi:hypothetical protein
MGQEVEYARPARVNYLANHPSTGTENLVLTVPDQYLSILQEYVIVRAWIERLSTVIQDPTAQDNTIGRINEAIRMHRELYNQQLDRAIKDQGTSQLTMNRRVDKYDRIY